MSDQKKILALAALGLGLTARNDGPDPEGPEVPEVPGGTSEGKSDDGGTSDDGSGDELNGGEKKPVKI